MIKSMNANFRRLSLVASLLLAVGLSACEFSLAADITPPPDQITPPPATQSTVPATYFPLVAPDPEIGQAIYTEKCAPCHGVTGRGDGPQASGLPNPVTALGDPTIARQATLASWYQVVTDGRIERYMPPFNSLDEGQRWAVAAYAISLSVAEVDLEAGAELFAQNCADCHGSHGELVLAAMDGTRVSFSDVPAQEYMASHSSAEIYTAIQQGVPPEMPGFAGALSESETWTLAAYVRSLSFSGNAQMVSTDVESVETANEPTEAVPVNPNETATVTATVEATAVAALENSPGSITGLVTNGSGGTLPEDLELTLHGLDQMQLVVTQTTTIKEDGSFAFDAVDFPENRVFVVTTEFGGATYGSDIAVAEAGVTSLDLPLTIYDTTTDTSQLVIDRLHVFFDFPTESTVQVVQLYVISNPSDETVVASEPGEPVVEFSLPEGYMNLQFQDSVLGERYIQTENGFADTAVVRPNSGEYQVIFAYELFYDEQLDWSVDARLPTDAIIVMAPSDGVTVKSEQLQDNGTTDVEGVSFAMYASSNLTAGDSLALSVSGRPKVTSSTTPSVVSTDSTTSLVVGLGVFGVVLVGAGIWLYRRTQSTAIDELIEAEEDEAPAAESVEETTYQDPDTVMDAIIALDELYAAGELPEDAYLARRGQLKARLQELMD